MNRSTAPEAETGRLASLTAPLRRPAFAVLVCTIALILFSWPFTLAGRSWPRWAAFAFLFSCWAAAIVINGLISRTAAPTDEQPDDQDQ